MHPHQVIWIGLGKVIWAGMTARVNADLNAEWNDIERVMNKVIFHLAFPIADMAQARAFYVDGMGCEVGRANANSMILNLYGHQLVAHLTHEPIAPQRGIYPRHFGLIFTHEADWEELLERAQRHGLKFYQQPKHRFPGLPLEHRTFFLEDPFHNLMEFKYYAHPSAIFGEAEYTQIGDRA